MKELDLLKKDWKKNDHSFDQISEGEIYKMIHQKSSSIVKWILIISILEIVFWSLLSLVFNSDDYMKKLEQNGLIIFFEVITYLSYAVIFVFIYLFYKNYILISTTLSTKKLMISILKTRKTVQCYVGFNLAMIVLGFIMGFIIAFFYNPELAGLKDKIANSPKMMVITFVVIFLTIAFFFGVFWLFYILIYGTLLKRLYANYNELKKIDL